MQVPTAALGVAVELEATEGSSKAAVQAREADPQASLRKKNFQKQKPEKTCSCGAQFSSFKKLEEHALEAHQMEYIYQCKYCPTKFNYRCNLIRHERAHVGNGIPCELCERILPNSGFLEAHMQKMHGAEDKTDDA
ncbi:hypothetical protein HPB50_018287 [Hyalomma asiaticum]|uniref:Uncharacterized protein n=1 Tax=Hyalomma asiaticum TaxID=266040 RepID=A0ACB7SXK5_HYAAI|nr:hypothetical protein HPB50_018287 [Hyalomma asiaticum]